MAGYEPQDLRKVVDTSNLMKAKELMQAHGVHDFDIKRALGGSIAQNEEGQIVLVPTGKKSFPPRGLQPDVSKKLNDLLYDPAFTDRRNWRIEGPRLQAAGKMPPARVMNQFGIVRPPTITPPQHAINKDLEMRQKLFPDDPGLMNRERQRALRENILRGAE